MTTQDPKNPAAQTGKDKKAQNPSANDPRQQGRTDPSRVASRNEGGNR